LEPLKIVDEIVLGWITILGQRLFIKIETFHSCTSTEVYELLQEVYGASKLDCSTFSHQCERFHKGWDGIEDKECSGRPRTSTGNTLVVIIATVLEEDRCMTCEEMVMESRIPKSGSESWPLSKKDESLL
jgi:hypothetical protein